MSLDARTFEQMFELFISYCILRGRHQQNRWKTNVLMRLVGFINFNVARNQSIASAECTREKSFKIRGLQHRLCSHTRQLGTHWRSSNVLRVCDSSRKFAFLRNKCCIYSRPEQWTRRVQDNAIMRRPQEILIFSGSAARCSESRSAL